MLRGRNLYCAVGVISSMLLGGCSWPDSWAPYLLAASSSTDGSTDPVPPPDLAECSASPLWAPTRLATGAQWLELRFGDPGQPGVMAAATTIGLTPAVSNFQATASAFSDGVRFRLGDAAYLDPKRYMLEIFNRGQSLGTTALTVKKIVFNDVANSKMISAATSPASILPITDKDKETGGSTVRAVYLFDAGSRTIYGVPRNPTDPGFSLSSQVYSRLGLQITSTAAAVRTTGPSRYISVINSTQLNLCIRTKGDPTVDSCAELQRQDGMPAFSSSSIAQIAIQPGVDLPTQRLAVWGRASGESTNALYECYIDNSAMTSIAFCNKVSTYLGSAVRMTLGDIDGVSGFDTVVQNSDNTLSVLLAQQQSPATLCQSCIAPGAQLPSGDAPIAALQVVDVDHDGLQDLLAVSSAGLHVWLQSKDKSSPYRFPQRLSSVLTVPPATIALKEPAQVVVGDLTGEPARSGFPDVMLIDSDGKFWVSLNQTPTQAEVRCGVQNPWAGRFSPLAPVITESGGTERQLEGSFTVMTLDKELDSANLPGLLLAKSTQLSLWKNATR